MLGSVFHTRKIDIIGVSETWSIKDISSLQKSGFKIVPKPRQSDIHGGVAILYRNNRKVVPRKDLEVPGLEATWAETRISGSPVLIGAIYIPPNKEKDISILDTVLGRIDPQTSLILMGDYNSRDLLWERWHTRKGTSKAWKMGKSMIKLSDNHNLQIINNGRYTREIDGIRSAPDLTLTRGLNALWWVDHCVRLNSDHLPIVITLPGEEQVKVIKWDLRNANWGNWRESSNQAFSAFSEQTREFNCEETVKHFNKTILECADSNIPKKTICSHSKSFMNPHLCTLLIKCKQEKKRYDNRSDPTNHIRYKKAVSDFINLYNKAKAENERDFKEKLSLSDPQVWRKINRLQSGATKPVIQPLRDSSGDLMFDDSQISDILINTHVKKEEPPGGTFDDNWYTVVNCDVASKLVNERDLLSTTEQVGCNCDIILEETQSAVTCMRSHSAPGPDQILPIMVKEGGPNMVAALHNTFIKCWSRGIFPGAWKREDRIYLEKPNKEDYTTGKSYRSISLSPVVGKLYERVGEARLKVFMSQNGLYEAYQYAYRRNRSLTQAMLLYSLSITKAIKYDSNAISCFVDLEAAFDKVWRYGIIYKLMEAGLSGRLLLFIASYLEGRVVRNRVNSHTSNWLTSDIGVPQGSVVGPVLFIMYIAEMTHNIGPHISYADDLTFWHINSDINECASSTERDLESITAWCRKWRMTVSVAKTDIMIHSKNPNTSATVRMNGTALKSVTTKKCLGIILDPKMTLKQHVDYVCSTALGALHRTASLFSGCSVELSLHLYKSLVRSHLERTYPIWCHATGALPKADRVQRQALLRSSGMFVSTPTVTLEVLTHTTPLRLRLQEVLLSEYGRIQCLNTEDALKHLIDSLMNDDKFLDHRQLTPVHMLKMALKDAPVTRYIHGTETAVQDNMDRLLQATPRIHGTDIALGSSRDRTQDQIQAAQREAQSTIARIPEGQPLAFTDGSALGNPGACGAAAVCYSEGILSTPVILKKPVSNLSTSYHGELEGLRLAAEFLCVHTSSHHTDAVHIFCDCRSAIQSLNSISIHPSHQEVIDDIRAKITALSKNGIITHLYWVAGHVDIKPNELADKAAKEAASEAENTTTPTVISRQAVKGLVKRRFRDRWQKIWDTSDTGRNVYEFMPKVPSVRYRSTHNRTAESKYLRLQAGHSRLNNHLYTLKLVDTPCCECSRQRETPQHILFHCNKQSKERQEMIDNIEMIYVKHQTPVWERTLDVATLLSPCHTSKATRSAVRNQVMMFLSSTEFKI